MICCSICKGTIETGCVCMAVAREVFPDIDKQYADTLNKSAEEGLFGPEDNCASLEDSALTVGSPGDDL